MYIIDIIHMTLSTFQVYTFHEGDNNEPLQFHEVVDGVYLNDVLRLM